MFLRRKGPQTTSSGNRPLSEGRPTKELPKGCLVLFFGIFLLAGLGISFPILVKPIAGMLAARSWVEVPATIVSSEVKRGDDTYQIEVSFRYTYRGRDYVSDQYGFVQVATSGYNGKAAIVRSLPPGRRVTCFVNPENPSVAVLNRGPSAGMLFGLLPLVFVLVGGGGIYLTLKKSGTPRGLPLVDRPSGTWAPGRGSAEPALRAPGGELRPRTSRRARLVGLCLIAAFWNGLISFFLFHVVSDWGRGAGPWLFTLFLVPFVLVGLALIGGVIHSLLGLFNPVVRLHVTDREVPVGGAFDLSWSIEGHAQRLQSLTITLEGSEHATYRRGTDTRTDSEVFHSTALFQSSAGQIQTKGSARCTIPAQSMHTFKSRNNEVRWTLRVRGEIPRWPDINDEYSLTVHPLTPKGRRS